LSRDIEKREREIHKGREKEWEDVVAAAQKVDQETDRLHELLLKRRVAILVTDFFKFFYKMFICKPSCLFLSFSL